MVPEHPAAYRAEAVFQDGDIVDVVVHVAEGGRERTWHMWGRKGLERELSLAREAPKNALPVLLGAGLGRGLELLLDQGPVAVVDQEGPILDSTRVRDRFQDHPNLHWIDRSDPSEAMEELDRVLRQTKMDVLHPLANPLYQRLNRPYYRPLLDGISRQLTPEAPGGRPSLAQGKPRILLITSKYFLLGEIEAACKRMSIPHLLLDTGGTSLTVDEFAAMVTNAVSSFRPDFAFTVNHLGVDHEGVLLSILDRFRIPLASWFVDNPHLILYLYAKPAGEGTVLFTWDSDNLPTLRERGFQRIHHLPLAADTTRFTPDAPPGPDQWRAGISFVGNSMVYKTAKRLKAANPPGPLARAYRSLAAEFAREDDPSVAAFLARSRPNLHSLYEELKTPLRKLAYETCVTWEATKQYRMRCLEGLMEFGPLICGDKGWKRLFREHRNWRYHPELSYYEDLPRFYPLSTINFNCTSMQMKGAVNQRVFDVPAAGAFLLTDQRRQMEELFEPGKEVAVYTSPEEVPEACARWLADTRGRQRLARAARARVLAQHTYEHRMARVIEVMRETF